MYGLQGALHKNSDFRYFLPQSVSIWQLTQELKYRASDTSVGFEVITALVMKSTIFWDITPCRSLSANRRFGGTHRLQNVGWHWVDYTALYPRGWYSLSDTSVHVKTVSLSLYIYRRHYRGVVFYRIVKHCRGNLMGIKNNYWTPAVRSLRRFCCPVQFRTSRRALKLEH
jgi:hypothetical protein